MRTAVIFAVLCVAAVSAAPGYKYSHGGYGHHNYYPSTQYYGSNHGYRHGLGSQYGYNNYYPGQSYYGYRNPYRFGLGSQYQRGVLPYVGGYRNQYAYGSPYGGYDYGLGSTFKRGTY